MKVPARFYATQTMLPQIFKDRSLNQLVNVTALPGINKYALAMPDIHEGYGFPIGGVAAIEAETGVISPGGVGYDINCGVRLLISQLFYEEIKDKLVDLTNQIQRDVPSGVGRGGMLRLNTKELNNVLKYGARWAVQKGYGTEDDLNYLEENGEFKIAEPTLVSDQAKKRGADQIGTLGAGNHFLEIQKVTEVFDLDIAKQFGVEKNKITVMIHTGSRGLGHQVCTDYVRLLDRAAVKYNIKIPDRELACVPFKSDEGQKYFKAMAAAANFAWCNR
ncbi:MAG TPA: RtcB family protein, partial [Patescibacteria group bacterium]|nr:RtcB family protein [Patescibacteria group bacterium]